MTMPTAKKATETEAAAPEPVSPIQTANITSTSGLTAVDVEMDTETGKGLVTVTTYGRVTHTVPLQGEQMGDDDTP